MIGKIFDILTVEERRRLLLVFVMMVIMAILDVMGIASIMPFIQVLADPSQINKNPVLNSIYTGLKFQESQKFLVFLGIIVFVLFLLSIVFKAVTTYVQLNFAVMREYAIGKRLVEGYLHQPYSWFLNRHSAVLGSKILSETGTLVGNFLLPAMNMVAHGFIAFMLLVLLIAVDPLPAIQVGLTLGVVYLLIYKMMNGQMRRIDAVRYKKNLERWGAVNEAFAAAKEIKFGGLEDVYVRRFSRSAEVYSRMLVNSSYISQFPRFAMEALVFGGLILILIGLTIREGGVSNVIPVVTLYAFVGYRLLPSLNIMYGSLAQLKANVSTLHSLHADILDLINIDISIKDAGDLTLNESIRLSDISYNYPYATNMTLKGISLTIPAKSSIGFIGTTGSGKTTLVDVILCLLKSTKGSLVVDGTIINEHNRRDWQRMIGYVPQQIFLSDESIAANIAFGIDSEKIDYAVVEKVSKIAELHEFVINHLPEGYLTKVGERGVRLSGGQRQRIGIARALYHNPQLLILDEATSALDNLTEQAVMNSIEKLDGSITMILIAHRLSTLRNCDIIYVLEKGEIKASGTYNEMKESNQFFQYFLLENQQ